MTTKRELLAQEDVGWASFIGVVESLFPEKIERPGYSPEGWSVKDLMAHIGCWEAEAGWMLERIRYGTYHDEPIDVDALNREFYEANKDLPPSIVRAEMWAARTRMLIEWNALPQITPPAEEWFRESGPAHYDEHLGRLREWASELRGDSAQIHRSAPSPP
jgi:hypothetical protein